MSAREWYILGFVLTLFASLAFWSLAALIYRKDRRNPLNRSLALTFLFAGFWVLTGFVEKITSQHNDTLALWSYRLAHAFGNPGLLCLLYFTIALYLGRSPGRKVVYPFYCLGITMAAFSLTSVGIRHVSYTGATLEVVPGPLFVVISAFQVLAILGVLLFLIWKWHVSKGIDYARVSTILLGVTSILPVAIICNIILPSVSRNALSSNFTFLVGATITPAAFFYSIYRYRLLDIRLILRKSGVVMLSAIAFSLPIIAILILSFAFDLNRVLDIVLIALLLPAMVILYPYIWNKLERFSARVFFSSLYDSVQVQEELDSRMARTSSQVDNIHLSLSMLLETLGLDRSEFWFTPTDTRSQGMAGGYFVSFRDVDDSIKHASLQDTEMPRWLGWVKKAVVTEELERWPENETERTLGEALEQRGMSACVPARTGGKTLGYLLVGKKFNLQALSATDIDLMEKVGSRLALYLDNYALSTELSLRMEELRKADQFKREIITLTAHEFKTPITVVNGLSEILRQNWDTLSDGKREMCLENIRKASLRLVDLSEEVVMLSSHYAGTLVPRISMVNINVLLEKLLSSYDMDGRNRIVVEKKSACKILETDMDKLFMVLKQIVNNALFFSDDHQPVILTIEDNPTDSGLLTFSIQDYGKGLSQEDVDRVFEPFFQVGDLRHHTKGIGLGLHLVKILGSLLDLHIRIDSSPGKGTTFHLEIPVRKVP